MKTFFIIVGIFVCLVLVSIDYKFTTVTNKLDALLKQNDNDKGSAD